MTQRREMTLEMVARRGNTWNAIWLRLMTKCNLMMMNKLHDYLLACLLATLHSI